MKVFHICKYIDTDCKSPIAWDVFSSTSWYMDDGEYYPSVNFCPYCGEKLDRLDVAKAQTEDVT